MDIISRGEWGARTPRSRVSVSWSQRTEFVVHYSAGPTSQTPRQIQNFHMDSNGWSDVGYNFLVDRTGRIYEGRGWLVIGAQAQGRNTIGIGVCFIGRDGDATDDAKRSIRALYDEAVRRKGGPLRRAGHGQLPGQATACPGSELRKWVDAGMPVGGRPEGDDDMDPDTKVEIHDYYEGRGQFSHDAYPAGFLWQGAVSETRQYGKAILAKLDAQAAVIDKLADAVGQVGGFDPETLKTEIREAIESIKVRLDVPDAPGS